MKAAWTPTQWGRARVTLRWVTHNAELCGGTSATNVVLNGKT